MLQSFSTGFVLMIQTIKIPSSNMVEEDSLLIDEDFSNETDTLNYIPHTFSTVIAEMNSLYYVTGYIALKMLE